MKKRFFAGVLSALLVLSTTVFALPQTDDTTTGKVYDGSTELSLANDKVGFTVTTEQAYHCGASSKDAGKKLCAINVIADTSMIHPVIDKLLLAADKKI